MVGITIYRNTDRQIYPRFEAIVIVAIEQKEAIQVGEPFVGFLPPVGDELSLYYKTN